MAEVAPFPGAERALCKRGHPLCRHTDFGGVNGIVIDLRCHTCSEESPANIIDRLIGR